MNTKHTPGPWISPDHMDPLNNINWEELKKQKLWILQHDGPEPDGLLSLIDAIQDYAVNRLGVPESEVFNLK